MNNVQFATAIHILAMLAIQKSSLSSAKIAESIQVDSAIVRKSLRLLGAKGLVVTKEGKGGGTLLAKPAKDIMLSDVYLAVTDNSTSLLGRLNHPDPNCFTGRQINLHITNLYNFAENKLIKALGETNLEAFTKQFE